MVWPEFDRVIKPIRAHVVAIVLKILLHFTALFLLTQELILSQLSSLNFVLQHGTHYSTLPVSDYKKLRNIELLTADSTFAPCCVTD